MALEPPTLPKVVLWYNAACSKSRRARELLETMRVETELFEYLETAPSVDQLRELAGLLGGPRTFLRDGEGLDRADDDAVIAAMAKEPSRIQRPIGVVADRKLAVVARPPELILQVLVPQLPDDVSSNELIRRMIQKKLPGG